MNQPLRSDPDLLVLHTLRCIGVAGEERVAEASGLETGEAVLHLRDLSERGMVVLDPGPFGGWGVTERGRITDEELARSELDTVDARDHVLRSYESFLGLNPALLDTCGAWQMRRLGSTPMLNDHTDSDYDPKVLSRLIRIDVSAQRICSELTSRLCDSVYTALVSELHSSTPSAATSPTSPTPSIRTTRCGSSSTKTFWSRSGSHVRTREGPRQDRRRSSQKTPATAEPSPVSG